MASQLISQCLWFDTQAEEAAKFYTGIFKNSKITKVTRYGEAGKEVHQQARRLGDDGGVRAKRADLYRPQWRP